MEVVSTNKGAWQGRFCWVLVPLCTLQAPGNLKWKVLYQGMYIPSSCHCTGHAMLGLGL